MAVGGADGLPQIVIDNAGIDMNNQKLTGLADGINNLADALSNIVALIGFKLSRKKNELTGKSYLNLP